MATKGMVIKTFLYAISLFIFATLCVTGLFYVGAIARYQEPKTLRSLFFQQYEPKVLPNGIKLTTKRLVAYVDRRSQLDDFALNLGLSKFPSSGITEKKAQKGSDKCEAHNVDTGVSLCQTLKTPKGQTYTHLKDPHRDKSLNSETVRFIKDGTFFYIDINVGKEGFIPEAQWQAMIDSFVPVDYKLDPIYTEPAL